MNIQQQRQQKIRDLFHSQIQDPLAREVLEALLAATESAQEQPDVTDYYGMDDREVVDAKFTARNGVGEDIDLDILEVLEKGCARTSAEAHTAPATGVADVLGRSGSVFNFGPGNPDITFGGSIVAGDSFGVTGGTHVGDVYPGH